MSIAESNNDTSVLRQLGERLARLRIERGWTQAQLAERAGIAKRTLERLEAGEATQLTTLVRVLREFDLLGALDQALPGPAPGPLALARGQGKQRRRAGGKAGEGSADAPWRWGDEE